jgi:hypothetical protein
MALIKYRIINQKVKDGFYNLYVQSWEWSWRKIWFGWKYYGNYKGSFGSGFVFIPKSFESVEKAEYQLNTMIADQEFIARQKAQGIKKPKLSKMKVIYKTTVNT